MLTVPVFVNIYLQKDKNCLEFVKNSLLSDPHKSGRGNWIFCQHFLRKQFLWCWLTCLKLNKINRIIITLNSSPICCPKVIRNYRSYKNARDLWVDNDSSKTKDHLINIPSPIIRSSLLCCFHLFERVSKYYMLKLLLLLVHGKWKVNTYC